MKKLILSLALGLVAIGAQAQYAVQTWQINSNVVTNLLIRGDVNIRRVTASANGTATALYFYNYNTNGGLALGSLQYSNTTAFSNLVTVNPYTNEVVFVNSLGVTQTNKYRGIYQYWTNVATATASNALLVGAIDLASGIPYTLDVNWNPTKGLTVRGTNNANTIIILEYQ